MFCMLISFLRNETRPAAKDLPELLAMFSLNFVFCRIIWIVKLNTPQGVFGYVYFWCVVRGCVVVLWGAGVAARSIHALLAAMLTVAPPSRMLHVSSVILLNVTEYGRLFSQIMVVNYRIEKIAGSFKL